MHGLDFDHRVLQPWANNPAFYVTIFPSESDQPAREGPFAYGAVELWQYAESARGRGCGARLPPASAPSRACSRRRGRTWSGTAAICGCFGARDIRQQSADLQALAGRLPQDAPALRGDVERARQATDEFAAWLDTQAASKTGPSGVGVDNYDWYLKHVMLVPYTWRELVTRHGA